MGAQPTGPPATAVQRLIPLVKTLQFAWFTGHLCLILCVLRYTSLWIWMNYYSSTARFCYRAAFISAATTYGIAVYKIRCFRAELSRRVPGGGLSIATHETFQYLALALLWLVMPPRPIALLPYLVYSIFHVAVYTRSELIPILKDPILDPTVVRKFQDKMASKFKAQIKAKVVNTIQTHMENNPNPLGTTLTTTLGTNLNLDIQTTLETDPVAPAAAAALDAGIAQASESIADKISAFITKHYELSVSVLPQTILSFFIPQWIYPIFHLVTRIVDIPIDTSGANPQIASTPDAVADNIRDFIKTYYDICMSVVTRLEITIWFSLLVSAMASQPWSWVMTALYTVFLRARLDLSDFERLEGEVDSFLSADNIPPAAHRAWKIVMALTRQFYHVSDFKKYTGGGSTSGKPKEQ